MKYLFAAGTGIVSGSLLAWGVGSGTHAYWVGAGVAFSNYILGQLSAELDKP